MDRVRFRVRVRVRFRVRVRVRVRVRIRIRDGTLCRRSTNVGTYARAPEGKGS